MLKENGPPPEGRFADLQFLEPVRDYKARHASTLLTFDAVVAALPEGRGAYVLAYKDANARTPLHFAATAGEACDEARAWYEHRKEVARARVKRGRSALLRAREEVAVH